MASSAATANRRARQRPSAAAGIRWDRVVGWSLRAGAAILVLMSLKAAVGIAATAIERSDRGAELRSLEAENAKLKARRTALRGEGGVELEARRLGMVKPGEVPVVVTGLPGDRR